VTPAKVRTVDLLKCITFAPNRGRARWSLGVHPHSPVALGRGVRRRYLW